MALTKQDFQEIQKIVKETIDYSFENDIKKSIKETIDYSFENDIKKSIKETIDYSFEHSFKKTVKDIVSKEVESLAVITNKTFTVMEKRFDKIDKRFEDVDKRFDANDSAHRSINARLDLIETDLSDLRNLVYEVQDLRRILENLTSKDEARYFDRRLLRVEKHLGLSKIKV